ncbi:MAG: hypothetical protein ABL998_12780 [Planctomycetota bacterium]
MRRPLESLTIVLFLLALVAPAVDQLLRPDGARDCRQAEQRPPEPRPGLPRSLVDVAAFPRRYERHYLDTFGLRDVLLRWNSREQWLGLGHLPVTTWESGRDGWCFYLGEDSRAVHRGMLPFRPGQVDDWVRRLRERQELFAARGIRYLFVLCPNKETIYPEFTPATWAPLGPTRMDEFAARLAAEGDLSFLDLRPALLAAKAEDGIGDRLYTPLGTHWNGRGTFAAYTAIVARLQGELPALVPVRREDCARLPIEGRGDGVGMQLYIDDLVPREGHTLRPAAGPGYRTLVRPPDPGQGSRTVSEKAGPAPRLLWLHDSFGPYLQDLVAETFSSVHAYWSQDLELTALDEARPDVVLETFVERVLAAPKPYRPIRRGNPLTEEFARASLTLWSTRDPSAPPARVMGEAGLETRDGRLHLRCRGIRAGLLLPPLKAAADDRLLLRLEARCTEAFEVDVFVRPAGARLFQPQERQTLSLGPALSAGTLRLLHPGGTFEILVRPRPPASELELELLELRQAPRR